MPQARTGAKAHAQPQASAAPSYDAALIAQVERAATVRLTGLSLDDGTARFGSMWPIQLCLCVQDSPNNPCRCTGPILWLPKSAVVRETPAGRNDGEGRALSEFVISRDARLVTQDFASHRAGAYVGASRLRGRRGMPSSINQDAPRGAAGAAGAVLAAFMAGWTLGKDLDAMTGGAMSDAGADLIETVAGLAGTIIDWLDP